jgi:hypothetical protein
MRLIPPEVGSYGSCNSNCRIGIGDIEQSTTFLRDRDLLLLSPTPMDARRKALFLGLLFSTCGSFVLTVNLKRAFCQLSSMDQSTTL